VREKDLELNDLSEPKRSFSQFPYCVMRTFLFYGENICAHLAAFYNQVGFCLID
jgi:hypothetical protein